MMNLNPSMDVFGFGCSAELLTLKLQPFVDPIVGVDSLKKVKY